MSDDKVRILCVDDEPHVLQALNRVLRRDYEVVIEAGGPAAVERLQEDGDFAVVVSDMRMPGVDGVGVLSAARRLAPDASRVLLTGHADVRAAIAAVNEGRILRFLTKPCRPEQLSEALEEAVERYRTRRVEREVLERTLHGSVQALVDFLALANPVAFGRATRMRRQVRELAQLMGLRELWPMEMAAVLSQVGVVGLDPDTAARYAVGAELDATAQAQVDALPEVAIRLLGDIPRLDEIREILSHLSDRFDGAGPQSRGGEAIPLGARLIRPILDYDLLRSQGCSAVEALGRLVAREGRYDPAVLSDLETITGAEAHLEVRELRLQEVERGMVFLDDVRSQDGTLLVARGQEVTDHLLERVTRYWGDLELPRPVRVTVPVAAVGSA
jgi:response regulator RpfG family c-di-GMP phosphodiesterase